MSNKLENAKNLYLQGIKEGKVEVVKDYSGERYTQHSTGVADGAQGFIDFFKGFLERTTERDIRIIRAIEDGNYIFVHVYQDIDNGTAKWITSDLFDTDENDKLIEHWDVISAYQEANETVSGNDMILGDFEIRDLDKTEKIKHWYALSLLMFFKMPITLLSKSTYLLKNIFSTTRMFLTE